MVPRCDERDPSPTKVEETNDPDLFPTAHSGPAAGSIFCQPRNSVYGAPARTPVEQGYRNPGRTGPAPAPPIPFLRPATQWTHARSVPLFFRRRFGFDWAATDCGSSLKHDPQSQKNSDRRAAACGRLR